jgi:rod shape-determining protein MreD
MKTILAIPVLGAFLVLQIVVVSRLPLLQGTADLMLLALVGWAVQEEVDTGFQWAMVGGFLTSLVSAMPHFAPLIGYMAVITGVWLLRRRIWQVPILAMFVGVFAGTLFQQFLYVAVLNTVGVPIGWREALVQVILPGMLLNLLLALPVYGVMTDLARRVYPMEVER